MTPPYPFPRAFDRPAASLYVSVRRLSGMVAGTEGVVEMTIRCGICGREFGTEDELHGHRHDAEDRAAEALSCPLCGERFGGEEQLVAHQASDHVGIDVLDEERAVP